MAKKDVIGQSLKMVIKVTGGEIKTDIGEKKSTMIELKGVTPEGCLIKIKNWVRESELDFINEGNDKLRDIVARANGGETIFTMSNGYVNKNGKQYVWLKSQESDEGKTYHEIEGFVDILDFETIDNVDMVTYNNFGTEVTYRFEDIENVINATMFVEDKNESKIYLTNDAEFTKELIIDSKDTDGAMEGVAYFLKLKFEKGAMVQADAVEAEWGSEEATGSASFAPDRLIATTIRKTDLESENIEMGSDDVGF